MQSFSSGVVMQARQLPPGSFFMLDAELNFTPAVIVENQGTRMIVDLDFSVGPTARAFKLLMLEDYGEQTAVHFEGARIVPDLSRGNLKSGRPHDYAQSKVLYLRGPALVIYAAARVGAQKFDLVTGQHSGELLESGVHVERWHIDCPAADGGFQTLINF